ncbi:MAG: hypothetical protein H7Y22_12785 [Gemmatimonadaceae bacterium]|nr:hypothetical protein [Gloeobacterales cyanobacterium ES-bin-141]
MMFSINQIVRLRNPDEVLLAEVKQMIVNARNEIVCWARPLVICTVDGVRDVRQSPDLLWPAASLEAAYDTEITIALGVLGTESLFAVPERTALLHQFIAKM